MYFFFVIINLKIQNNEYLESETTFLTLSLKNKIHFLVIWTKPLTRYFAIYSPILLYFLLFFI